MKDFGLACEGVTDQIVLENILFGFYDGKDDFEFDVDEISYLQPLLDATDGDGLGSWTRLLKYLENQRFRDDVVNHRFMIIQVDTDVAEQVGFDVVIRDGGKELSVEQIVENVKQRLIAQINSGKPNFYEQHQVKLIFAISVHSLECWLFNLHNKNQQHFGRIRSCEQHLRNELAKDRKNPVLEKTCDVYDEVSKKFYEKRGREIANVVKVDKSFAIFIGQLEQIDYPE
ncbi:hypothetical protein [Vibrio fluvialis]|uniref:hypothetical protein n=1 Tax=Vibrio fluvialis TaxID=676 RepID=UPI001EECA77E|nr:hypothetical protein [Vibrio fluvialis]MCG6351323.1 hypothetical protein [Vibrio fluvialis]